MKMYYVILLIGLVSFNSCKKSKQQCKIDSVGILKVNDDYYDSYYIHIDNEAVGTVWSNLDNYFEVSEGHHSIKYINHLYPNIVKYDDIDMPECDTLEITIP